MVGVTMGDKLGLMIAFDDVCAGVVVRPRSKEGALFERLANVNSCNFVRLQSRLSLN
jgi:hypothetical protein